MTTSTRRKVKSTGSPLLTFNEAMAYLRVSRMTLYRFLWSKQVVGHKVGSSWRFYRTDLDACIREVQP
jgi:excisionase family DNA binding protein